MATFPDKPTHKHDGTPKPLLIATEHREFVFGFCYQDDVHADTIELHDAKLILLWKDVEGGVEGLAHQGPNVMCFITEPVPVAVMDSIVLVYLCTAEAVEQWAEVEPLGRSVGFEV